MQVDNSGYYSVVGFEDETEETLKKKVISLVLDEASRCRVKLREKNLYWLYVVSDFYTRFLPSISDQNVMETANKTCKMAGLASKCN